MVQKGKGLTLRRKVLQFKIVLKIEILDNLETFFLFSKNHPFFRREAGNFSRHCLLRFTHGVNSRKCRKSHNIDFFKFIFPKTPRYLSNVMDKNVLKITGLRFVDCVHFPR